MAFCRGQHIAHLAATACRDSGPRLPELWPAWAIRHTRPDGTRHRTSGSAEMSISSPRISIHRMAYPLTTCRPYQRLPRSISYCLVGNHNADSGRLD
jgi:hypothetical protein